MKSKIGWNLNSPVNTIGLAFSVVYTIKVGNLLTLNYLTVSYWFLSKCPKSNLPLKVLDRACKYTGTFGLSLKKITLGKWVSDFKKLNLVSSV
jgi:hypothetical protein